MRGEKLSELSQQAEMMQSKAMDFATSAHMIHQKYKEKHKLF